MLARVAGVCTETPSNLWPLLTNSHKILWMSTLINEDVSQHEVVDSKHHVENRSCLHAPSFDDEVPLNEVKSFLCKLLDAEIEHERLKTKRRRGENEWRPREHLEA